MAIRSHETGRVVDNTELENPGIRGVHNTQAQALVCLHGKVESVFTIERDVLAETPGHHRVMEIAEARVNGAVICQAPIVQYQNDVAIDGRSFALVDNEHAIQSSPELLRRQEVRVIPKCTGIRCDKAVIETLARRDRHLRQVGHPVHCVGQTKSVPMDDSRLLEFVDEAHA